MSEPAGFLGGFAQGALRAAAVGVGLAGFYALLKAAATTGVYAAAGMKAGGIFAAGKAVAAVFLAGLTVPTALYVVGGLALIVGLYTGIDKHLACKEYQREMADTERLAQGDKAVTDPELTPLQHQAVQTPAPPPAPDTPPRQTGSQEVEPRRSWSTDRTPAASAIQKYAIQPDSAPGYSSYQNR